MAWIDVVVAGLFVLACTLSAWQAYHEDWGAIRLLGAALFLGGAAAALFLDELLSLPGLELVGAALILSGVLLTWRADGDRTAPREG
jgi:drug/metabolite transporter (DMT)-like permease